NALAPRLVIDPGDIVVFDTRDAADGYYSLKSTHSDVLARGPFRGHPLTGPVAVRGARPGDVLTVEILEVKPAAAFGWTAIRPGRGLMPEAEFPKPFLNIWDLTEGSYARMGRDTRVRVPIASFPGVMGVALDEPGGHSTMPPRKNGGHMGIKQMVGGAAGLFPGGGGGGGGEGGGGHAAPGGGGRWGGRGVRDLHRDDGAGDAPLRPRAGARIPRAALSHARARPVGARARIVLRHDSQRPRPFRQCSAGDPLHDRAPRRGAWAQPRR